MKNRQYIELPSPTPDAIRNAATKNPKGTWVMYGRKELPDGVYGMATVPNSDVMQSVRHYADLGLISPFHSKDKDGVSIYVFQVK